MEKIEIIKNMKVGMMGKDMKIDLLKKKIKAKKIGHLVERLGG